MNLRRVLILADESADWIVAGLRQLDRIALAIDEFAIGNNETAPVVVCLFWRPNLDESQRWVPTNPRLTKVGFTNESGPEPYDLVLSTRLFLYRKAIAHLLEEASPSALPQPPSWENYAAAVALPGPARAGVCDFIAKGDQIDGIERRFLRGSGKSQDGFVSRYLNRPISRAVTRLLLRFPATPNGWTWLIFPIAVVAAVVLAAGSYRSFVWGLVLFQVFSILDGCDGEIARAKFMESERGRRLDDLFDVLSNILLALGLGLGLRHAHERFGGFFLAEGIVTASLIALSEWLLARGNPSAAEPPANLLGGTLYPRHRNLIERSGLLRFGEHFASVLVQLTKRDVGVLFFLFLAVVGFPALILHLLLVVTAVTLAFALKR
ncbi:MAG TPA: CDP-alcohol phosphatidyltransferase family protein [Chthoniobacterales bacterium]|nr:CDP-alcohol phosphatidyltransferase family protein [Chthoniobacterales bacterium]